MVGEETCGAAAASRDQAAPREPCLAVFLQQRGAPSRENKRTSNDDHLPPTTSRPPSTGCIHAGQLWSRLIRMQLLGLAH